MTALWGGKKHPVSYAENTKRSKKSQALRMTALWGVKSIRLATQKNEKIEKVTGSQDDDFVGVLKKNIPSRLALMGACRGPIPIGNPVLGRGAARIVQEGRLCTSVNPGLLPSHPNLYEGSQCFP